jgi:hypothetical protein
MFAALIPALLGVLGTAADRLIPDPNARQDFMLKLQEALNAADLKQIEVNIAEAQHRSIFVAGWRPFIGWVCGAAMVYSYILLPLGGFVAGFFGEQYQTIVLNAPKLDGNLWELLFAMLGFGALRSFDKLKGIASR